MFCQEGRGDGCGWQVGYKIAMHIFTPEGQGDSPLLCSSETQCGLLHPPLDSSVKEKHGPPRAHSEESHKNDQRDGNLCCE